MHGAWCCNDGSKLCGLMAAWHSLDSRSVAPVTPAIAWIVVVAALPGQLEQSTQRMEGAGQWRAACATAHW